MLYFSAWDKLKTAGTPYLLYVLCRRRFEAADYFKRNGMTGIITAMRTHEHVQHDSEHIFRFNQLENNLMTALNNKRRPGTSWPAAPNSSESGHSYDSERNLIDYGDIISRARTIFIGRRSRTEKDRKNVCGSQKIRQLSDAVRTPTSIFDLGPNFPGL